MRTKGKSKTAAMMAAAVLCGGVAAEAANLVVTAPSNYAQSVMGVVRGSRVKTDIWGIGKDLRTDLNGDPGLFHLHVNGDSKIFLRQYTYSQTNLRSNELLDAENNQWSAPESTGTISTTVNTHAAASWGNYLIVTGYDLGNVSVCDISGSAITLLQSGTHSLLNEINGILIEENNPAYGASAKAHGEGLLVKGDNLYALASINKEGGYQNYDEGWLIRYRIGQDGSLERKDYTRVGKNTDEARLNLYNDHILVSAIGGYQNYGFGNGDTCITAATLSDDGGLSTGNTRNITLPNTFTNEQGAKDFRDLKVLPDGTAYVMRYNLGGAGGVEMDVYQTTVSNLMSENPVSWGNPVSSGTYDGWFGKLNAEYHTHRLWVEAGQNLLVYKDGNTTPQSWRATDFSNNSGMFQFNFMAMLQPDKVKLSLIHISEPTRP